MSKRKKIMQFPAICNMVFADRLEIDFYPALIFKAQDWPTNS